MAVMVNWDVCGGVGLAESVNPAPTTPQTPSFRLSFLLHNLKPPKTQAVGKPEKLPEAKLNRVRNLQGTLQRSQPALIPK